MAWLVSSALLSWYLSSFANYDATYGSLGAAIGLMMWNGGHGGYTRRIGKDIAFPKPQALTRWAGCEQNQDR